MASGLCVPHQQAAHMAAPTEGQNIKKTLANGEPSTHGAKRTLLTQFLLQLLAWNEHPDCRYPHNCSSKPAENNDGARSRKSSHYGFL